MKQIVNLTWTSFSRSREIALTSKHTSSIHYLCRAGVLCSPPEVVRTAIISIILRRTWNRCFCVTQKCHVSDRFLFGVGWARFTIRVGQVYHSIVIVQNVVWLANHHVTVADFLHLTGSNICTMLFISHTLVGGVVASFADLRTGLTGSTGFSTNLHIVMW